MCARPHAIDARTTPHGYGYLWTAALLFVATRLGLWLAVTPVSSDISLYYRYVALGVDHGYVAYKDFTIEYPPLAYWWMCVPRFLQADPFSPNALQQFETWQAYQQVYRSLMVVVDAAVCALACLLLLRRCGIGGGRLGICLVLASAALGHLLYDRLDNVMTLLLVGWAWCWLRAAEKNERRRLWSGASYFLLGASISFKLIPVLIVPFALLAETYDAGWRQMVRSAAILSLAVAMPFLLHWPSAGGGTLAFLGYHAERGLQVESLYGAILAVAKHCGMEEQAVHRHGAWNIEGPGAESLQTVSTGILLALVAVCFGCAFWKRTSFSRELAYAGGCTLLVASAAFSKVLSPQYFLWIVPLALLAAAELIPPSRRWAWLVSILVLLMTLTTTWLFPYHYYSDSLPQSAAAHDVHPWGLIPGLAWQAVVVLCMRNALLVGISLLLIVAFLRKVASLPNPRRKVGRTLDL